MSRQPKSGESGPVAHIGGATGTPPNPRWLRIREALATLIALLVIAAGLWSIVWSFRPDSTRADAIDRVFAGVGLWTAPSMFMGFLLLVIGGGLLRSLRAALITTLTMQGLSLAAYLSTLPSLDETAADATLDELSGITKDLVGASVTTALTMVVLLATWRSFRARLAPRSGRRAVAVFLGGLLLSAFVAFTLSAFFPGTLIGASERVVWAGLQAIGSPFTEPGMLRGHAGPSWIANVADTLSAFAIVAAFWVFLRSAREGAHMSGADEMDVRRLLLTFGEADSLGYFATRRDKNVIFAPDRRAAVTYRVEVSVCVASADPIGDPASWGAAITAWLEECGRRGWYPAALSASTKGAEAYVAHGLKALALGDEAIVRTDRFTLSGPAMKPLARAVRRLERSGATTTVRRLEDIPAAEVDQLARLADAWRGNATERGFSMALNRFGDAADGRSVVVTAYSPSGEPIGLLSFVPWGRGGLSLDLMRRSGTAENGVTEFMVASLARAADAMGIGRISLNFAMFRHVFSSADEVGAGPVTRAVDHVLSLASRFWQLESLYRANAKYLPAWSPRYLCYDSSLTFTRAALAAGVAEGFVPSIGEWRAVRRLLREDPRGATTIDRGPQFAAAVQALEAEQLVPPAPVVQLTEQQRWRRVKLGRLLDAGFEAYPARVPRDTTIAEVCTAYPLLEPDTHTGRRVSLTGRVRALRDFGRLTFVVLQDGAETIQVILAGGRTPAEAHRLFRRVVDLGDHLSVTGEVVTSRSGELSVLADAWVMAAKSLRPVPGLGTRFADPEARARNRSLDLIVNDDSLAILQQRSAAVSALRTAFVERGFTEVETPMLQAIHGGATARPFRTYINAYSTRLYLRIAPELYLKRLAVGGMPKIFEMNRNFRNEGADATHNPEFTSLEAYQAYADYVDMRILAREVILDTAVAVHGAPVALRPIPGDATGAMERVALDGEWPVIPVHEAVSRASGTALTSASSAADVAAVCRTHGLHVDPDASAGELVLELYDALVEKQTVLPTFYTDFPVETSPLTRVHRLDPRLSERWDLVAFGAELGTAYSELVDPLDQRDRLTQQSLAAARGDLEAMQLDESFLQALELGMPPTGGIGLGVDRIVMMLVGSNIRATLAFPFVRL